MVNLLSEMNVEPGLTRTVMRGIATQFSRAAPCYTQLRAKLLIFVKQILRREVFGRGPVRNRAAGNQQILE